MEIYWKIETEGFEGEVTAGEHEGWTQLQSFDFTVSKPGVTNKSAKDNNTNASKPQFSLITVTKTKDKSSWRLFQLASTAGGYPMTFHFMRTADNAEQGTEVDMEVKLVDAMIASKTVSSVGGNEGGEEIKEVLTIAYNEIEIGYHQRKESEGAADEVPRVGYSLPQTSSK